MRIRVFPIDSRNVRVDLKPNLLEFLVLQRRFEERYAVRARCVGRGWEWLWSTTFEAVPPRVARAIARELADRHVVGGLA